MTKLEYYRRLWEIFRNYKKKRPSFPTCRSASGSSRRDRGGAKGRKYSPCTFLWASLIIFWDGAVLPCTQDFFGDLAVGNARDSTLAAIWNNERMVELREKAAKGHIGNLKPCSVCDRPWRDTFLGVPREYIWKLLLKKMPRDAF